MCRGKWSSLRGPRWTYTGQIGPDGNRGGDQGDTRPYLPSPSVTPLPSPPQARLPPCRSTGRVPTTHAAEADK